MSFTLASCLSDSACLCLSDSHTQSIHSLPHAQVNIWDTGGLERYNSMTASYFRYCHAVILVYDASSPEQLSTLFALRGWIEEAKTASFLGDRVIFSLWGNKSDQLSASTSGEAATANKTLSPEVKAFLNEYSIPDSLHYFVSALTGENVVESLHSFIAHIDSALSVMKSGSITLSDPESPQSEISPRHQQGWRAKICSKC